MRSRDKSLPARWKHAVNLLSGRQPEVALWAFSHHVRGEDQDSLVFSTRPLWVIQQVGVILSKVTKVIPCNIRRDSNNRRGCARRWFDSFSNKYFQANWGWGLWTLLVVHQPVSKLLWLLLALPKLRLRWLALRDWEKDEVESMVFLRPPSTLVGYRNWV